MEKDGKRALKKDPALKGEIVDVCSKLKELQGLGENKVQVSLRFAEEWRKQQTVKNISISRISSDILQHIPTDKDTPPVVENRPTGTGPRSRANSDTHDQKPPVNNTQSPVIGSGQSTSGASSTGSRSRVNSDTHEEPPVNNTQSPVIGCGQSTSGASSS
ncbi:hypothetical protein BGX34_005250, partial [Mortierella sp. NVP85]